MSKWNADLPAIKKAKSWPALSDALRDHLVNGEDPLQFVKRLVLMRERQRLGDKERNLRRQARLAYFKEHPELLPDELK